MRKTLLQTLLAAFCAILPSFSGMGGGGMMLGARIGCWSKSGYTARDYVQDGLIAMWDGIENAGWGVHDPNATVWKDLIGNKNMSLAGNALFDKNSMATRSDSNCYAYYDGEIFGSENTIELIFSGRNASQYNSIFTRQDDAFSVYTGPEWKVKCVNPRPFISPVVYKPIIVWWDSAGLVLSYQDRSVSGRSDGKYTGGGSSRWIICGLDDSHRFSGNVYRVCIYNRVLSAAEIAANYAVDKARFGIT